MNDVVNHMPEKPEAGSWQGKGEAKPYILGNPSSFKEKEELINKYALLESVKKQYPIDHKTFHLHQYAHHMNSSQIMCYNFFRPLMEGFDGEMYHAKESLVRLIGGEIGEDLEHHGGICKFEYKDRSEENTNFDFYFREGEIETFFEIKYTEEIFANSSSSSNPHEQYEEVYKPMIEDAKDIFKGGTISEENLNTKYYQLARNAMRATTKDKHVFFIIPQEREDLKSQFEQFSAECLTEEGKRRVALIYWENLVENARNIGIDVDEFSKRYLDFLK